VTSYILADNIDAGGHWIGKLFDASEALGQTPGMTPARRPDISSGFVVAGRRVPHHL
jgi:plasmid stabilization system protein ParE